MYRLSLGCPLATLSGIFGWQLGYVTETTSGSPKLQYDGWCSMHSFKAASMLLSCLQHELDQYGRPTRRKIHFPLEHYTIVPRLQRCCFLAFQLSIPGPKHRARNLEPAEVFDGLRATATTNSTMSRRSDLQFNQGFENSSVGLGM